MLWPCQETLRQVTPHLPEELITPRALSNLITTAARFPPAMSSYYLEFRLSPAVSQVDVSACISTAHGGRSVLQRLRGEVGTSAEAPAQCRAWSFLERWATPGSAIHEQIPLVWLEYDRTGEELPREPIPSINFCLDPTFLTPRKSSSEPPHPNTREYPSFADAVLEQLLGHPVPERSRQTLATCFGALPPGGHIDYLAIMLGRTPPALKVNGLVPREHLEGYLARIAWPGEWEVLRRVLDTYVEPSAPIRLDLTIDGTVTPRLGVECFAGESPAEDPGRRRLLERLVEHGHCCPRKSEAVLCWPGESQVVFAAQSWLSRIRRFWHLKLVCHGGHLIESKVYLGFTPGLISPFDRGLSRPAHRVEGAGV